MGEAELNTSRTSIMSPGLTLPTITKKEVETHNNSKSCYVTIDEKVYDVTAFLDDHPGGGELILEYAGKDIKEIMKDEVSHFHSESAYEILDDSLVGFMPDDPVIKAAVKSDEPDQILPLPATSEGNELIQQEGGATDLPDRDESDRPLYAATGMSSAADLSKDTDTVADYKKYKFLDLEKPLITQVYFGNFTKEFYLEQVHRPRHYRGGASAPLMPFAFLEPLSLTPWYVVPIVWLPPVAYGTYLGLTNIQPLPLSTFYWALGLFLWSVVEYVLHRFLFHIEAALPDHPIALTVHFLLHGVHHYLPMDKYRLVMPPTLFLALATPFWKLAHTVFYWDWYVATMVFSGGIFGYICYDLTHYFLHHKNLPSYWKSLKKYHLQHHFADFENGFGVTSRFWDWVFNTELEYVKQAQPIKAA